MSIILAPLLSLVLGPVMIVVLRRLHALDEPCHRSSHQTPTLRGGGVAPAVAATVALLAARKLTGGALVALLVASILYGVIGLVEDLRGVPALPRLAAQLSVAVATLPWLLGDLTVPWSGQLLFGAGFVLWLTAYVNAFNFMDGINGISVAQVVVAGVAWWALAQASGQDTQGVGTAGLLVAVAALGFLPYNFPSARMFLGDVGSYFLGGWLAVLAVLGLRVGITFEAMFAPLALYLADTGATLVRRVRRGDSWYQSHRDHTYQYLHHGLGWSHTQTTALATAVMVGCSVLGAVSETSSLAARVTADLTLAGLLTAYLALPRVLANVRQRAGATADDRRSSDLRS